MDYSSPIYENPINRGRPSIGKVFDDRSIYLSWYLIMLSEVLSGPFRFYLEGMGLSLLVYMPKVMALGILFRWIGKYESDRLVLPVLVMFAISGIIALIYGLSIGQIGFGLWIYLYLLFGIPMWVTIQGNEKRFIHSCLVGWLIAVVGVFINSQTTFPWVGFGYTIAGVEVEGNREWSTYDIDRLAGFGRTSINTAGQILVLSLVALPVLYRRSKVTSVALVLASSIAIILTTAKSVAGAYLICLAIWLISLVPTLAMYTGFVTCLLSMALPFTTLFITYRLDISTWWGELLFQSFEERLLFTWPLSLRQIFQNGDPIFGLGLGGVGSAQKNFSNMGPSLYDLSFTDSFSLFIFGTFGILGVGILIALSYGLCRKISRDVTIVACVAIAALGSILTGGASDLIEGGIPAIFIGLAISLVVQKNRKVSNLLI